MLKINNEDSNDVEVKIDFNPFEAIVGGKKRKGDALYITCIDDEFKLIIETVYDINRIKELNEKDKKDISKYIIGLSYEDKNGWMYLTEKCICSIYKINEKTYNLVLNGTFKECEEILDIEFEYDFEI